MTISRSSTTIYNRTVYVPPSPTVNEGSSTNATFSTLTNPDGDGKNYRLAVWTTSGTLVVTTEGYAQLLVVGGGGGGAYRATGGAGGVRWGGFQIPSGTLTITVGAGGAQGDITGSDGGVSAFGTVLRCGGGGGGAGGNAVEATSAKGAPSGGGGGGGMQINTWGGPVPGGGAGGSGFPDSPASNGVVLKITGSNVEYGTVGPAPSTPGSGGRAGANASENGSAGVVIARWEI